MKRIAVLTSGGDSPGMNAAIRAVVRVGVRKGLEVFGVERGFCGLIEGRIKKMSFNDVAGIMEKGGTILRSSRCEEFRTTEGRKKAAVKLREHNIDGLVVIGGEGSLTGALILYEEHTIPVVGIPGTIDNDIGMTDMCVGVDTCLNTVVDAIQKLKDTASSHERAFIVETMGRESGYIALVSGLTTGAEAVIVPEVPVNYDTLSSRLLEERKRGKINCIIVVAEGAKPEKLEEQVTASTKVDNFGHVQLGGVGKIIAKEVEKRTGYETRVTILGHLQRGGKPTAFDRIVATRLGVAAVDLVHEGKFDNMVCIKNEKVIAVPIEEALKEQKPMNFDLYELSKIFY